MVLDYRAAPEEDAERKRVHEYRTRDFAKTVFGTMKVRFTGNLRLRRFKEQRRELLIKAILHNIGFLGV